MREGRAMRLLSFFWPRRLESRLSHFWLRPLESRLSQRIALVER
jgi:hypothetical protein